MTNSKSGKRTPKRSAAGRVAKLVVARSRYKVRDLLGDAQEAIIEHHGQDYRLRITSSGKLFLTK